MLSLLGVLIVGFVSILLVRKVPRIGNDYFDIGIWVVSPVVVMLGALVLFHELGVELIEFKDWIIFRDIELLERIIWYYLLFIFFFSVFYNIFSNFVIIQTRPSISYRVSPPRNGTVGYGLVMAAGT